MPPGVGYPPLNQGRRELEAGPEESDTTIQELLASVFGNSGPAPDPVRPPVRGIQSTPLPPVAPRLPDIPPGPRSPNISSAPLPDVPGTRPSPFSPPPNPIGDNLLGPQDALASDPIAPDVGNPQATSSNILPTLPGLGAAANIPNSLIELIKRMLANPQGPQQPLSGRR